MAYSIDKEFDFSASHILHGLAEGHKCGRMHGHNYRVQVVLLVDDEDLNSVGFVRDYDELSMVKHFLDQEWDHRHLNDCLTEIGVETNPSAEVLAKVLFDRFVDYLPELIAVRVSETPRTWATYERD